MQVTSWIDRITDESTLWLNAVRSEDQNDLVRAATLYLRDASNSLAQNKPVWGALSCSCAADCLLDAGLDRYARMLHRESGRIYLERAGSVALSSVREMLWAFRQSHNQFLLAGDEESANEVYRRMAAVSRRIDPFSVDLPLVPPEIPTPTAHGDDGEEAQENSQIVKEVEKFLRSRATGRYEAAPQRAKGTQGPAPRRSQTNEKSIINQLG